MMIEDPYAYEGWLYEKTPPEHRWIFSKIGLGQKLGYPAGPVGMKVPAGVYCVRPDINLQGMAKGGFRRVVLDEPGYIHEPVGHCWTLWSDEPRSYNVFIDDVCFKRQVLDYKDGNMEYFREVEPDMLLPDPLRGISRYMMVETLGNMVIDVGPRHMVDEMWPEVVEDYRQFVPDYEPPSYGSWGWQYSYEHVWSDKLQAWTLRDPEYDL